MARLGVEKFKITMINSVIVRAFGRRSQLWEGCLSSGLGEHGMFAKVPRYKKVELKYLDEKTQEHTEVFEGLPAHEIHHEVDHLNGVLFVDRVKDTKTYMKFNEYKSLIQSRG